MQRRYICFFMVIIPSYFLFCLILLLSCSSLYALDAKDKETLELMDFAVRQTIKETGVGIIGVGSWTSQKNYKGPLSGGKSDHDMRVVLVNDTNNKVLTNKWKDFQNKLKENIIAVGQAKRLTGNEINSILNSTNVYPPDQLVETIEDAEDAKKLFTRSGAKPNLGTEPVEGLWGPGSKTYKQYYEEKSGKLFFIDEKNGKVMAGATDLTHMVEGVGRYTTAGEVNKAGQWADKVIEQLEEGNMDKVAKQAERLRSSVNKARGLERLGGRIDYLDDIVSGKVTDPDTIKAAIARARNESNLLLALSEESRVQTRNVLRNVLLNDGAEASKMSRLFWKYADKVPVDRLFRAFQLYSYYVTIRDTSTMTGADFNAAVLNSAGKELAWLAGPLAGLAIELADLTLQMAREGAYNIVTAFQDCENLATGIHSVKGREELNKGMTMDQMVSTFQDTRDGRKRLQNFVWHQAYQASLRLENNKWIADNAIQNNLYRKCYAPIFNMWREKRLEKVSAFNILFKEFDKKATNAKAVLALDPSSNLIPLRGQTKQEKTARVTVTGTVSQDQGKMEELVRKMNELLKTLEGSTKNVIFANFAYQLSLDGKAYNKAYKPVIQSMVFTGPENHNVLLTVETVINGTFLSEDIEKHGVLQGYRKQYTTKATMPFSIVEDTTRVQLRLDCPSSAKPGQVYPLAAHVEKSNEIPQSSIKISWASITANKRLSKGYEGRINHTEKMPGRYEYLAESYIKEQGRMIKVGDARCIVEIKEEQAQKKISQKSNKELARAEGQAICDCMNNYIQRTNDRPGNEFVFHSRWSYDVSEQKCKDGKWSAKGVGLSGWFPIGVVRGDYWDEKANRCKGP